MRTRNLKPGFFKNEHLAQLSPLTRILFTGLWCLADRDGILEDRPQRIKAEVLPYDNCEINDMLDGLQCANFLTRYKDSSGQQLLHIHNFNRHQHVHPKEAESKHEPSNYKFKPVKAPLPSLPSLPSLKDKEGGKNPAITKKQKQTPVEMVVNMARERNYTIQWVAEHLDIVTPYSPDDITRIRHWLEDQPRLTDRQLDARKRNDTGSGSLAAVGDVIADALGSVGHE